jgi:hypothetical protein
MTQAQLKITGPALRAFAGMYIAHYFGPGLSEREFRSNVKPDEPTFQSLTGFTHQALVAKWNSGNPKDKGYTTCGDVVGHFTKDHLGLGWIGLISPEPAGCQAWCDAQGKGIAWIPSSRGLEPKLGDLFKQSLPGAVPPVPNHVGISFFLDGGTWWTIEGGQGRPSQYDAVKKKNSNRLSNGIVGWIDLELWAEANDNKFSTPVWLVGFWKVVYRQNQIYYYYFAPNHQAAYTTDPTQAQYLPLKVGMGRFAMTSAQSITVLWFETGEIERYKPNPGVTDYMVGSWNDTPDQLTGERITDINALVATTGPFAPW